MTALPPTGAGGGQHHQASSLIARDAFKAAADPSRFQNRSKPDCGRGSREVLRLLAGRLRPEFNARRGEMTLNLAAYDDFPARTYADIGSEARSMHKCQARRNCSRCRALRSRPINCRQYARRWTASLPMARCFDGHRHHGSGLVRSSPASARRSSSKG